MKKLSLLNTRVNVNVYLVTLTDLERAQDLREGTDRRCVRCLKMSPQILELEVGRAPDEDKKDLSQIRYVLESDYMCVPCFESASGGPLPSQEGEEVDSIV
jgi:hypothetical protein